MIVVENFLIVHSSKRRMIITLGVRYDEAAAICQPPKNANGPPESFNCRLAADNKAHNVLTIIV